MPLLSNMELKGIERGKEIGSLEKARQAVKRVLEIRFGEVFSEVGAALVQVSNVLVLMQSGLTIILAFCKETFN